MPPAPSPMAIALFSVGLVWADTALQLTRTFCSAATLILNGPFSKINGRHACSSWYAGRGPDGQVVPQGVVCGVSGKPNVSDIRDAPQSSFCKTLADNNMEVHFLDPLMESFEGLKKVPNLTDIASYDRVFVMHKHEMCKMELEALRAFPQVVLLIASRGNGNTQRNMHDHGDGQEEKLHSQQG